MSRNTEQESQSWTTIESDPGVFEELLARMGVRGVEVEERLDISFSPNTLAVIFLFKWENNAQNHHTQHQQEDERAVLLPDDPDADEQLKRVYFARQMIQNACATQALFNVLMNRRNDIDLGTELNAFYEFTQPLDSESRGEALTNSDSFKAIHNSFAQPEPFHFERDDDDEQGDSKDLFHFIGFVPVDGMVYELDGLQHGPILIGPYDTNNSVEWLDVTADAIRERIERYATNEIRFNLMAIVKSSRDYLRNQLEMLQSKIMKIEAQLSGSEMSTEDSNISSEFNELSSNKSTLREQIELLQSEKLSLQDQLSDSEHRMQQHRIENVRRKQNYVPLLYHLLELLAQKKALPELVDHAIQRANERQQRRSS